MTVFGKEECHARSESDFYGTIRWHSIRQEVRLQFRADTAQHGIRDGVRAAYGSEQMQTGGYWLLPLKSGQTISGLSTHGRRSGQAKAHSEGVQLRMVRSQLRQDYHHGQTLRGRKEGNNLLQSCGGRCRFVRILSGVTGQTTTPAGATTQSIPRAY
ncbi:MAG: hypothetical protein JRJ45_06910 [Deltaproteobacteria bacterium]|nr:hypothetical protein [Deltaproteobacteria bacterium]